MEGIIRWKREETLEELELAYKKEKQVGVRMRKWAIWQMRRGRSGREVSQIIGVHQRTVYKWLSKYENSGLEALKGKPKTGRPKKITDAVIEEIRQQVRRERFRTLSELRQWIKDKYKVNYSLSGLWFRTRAWGVSWKVGRRQHIKANIGEQESFKKGA